MLGCSRVQNLFHSVQLNVNNPHFLIMQGRITKVQSRASNQSCQNLSSVANERAEEISLEISQRMIFSAMYKIDSAREKECLSNKFQGVSQIGVVMS